MLNSSSPAASPRYSRLAQPRSDSSDRTRGTGEGVMNPQPPRLLPQRRPQQQQQQLQQPQPQQRHPQQHQLPQHHHHQQQQQQPQPQQRHHQQHQLQHHQQQLQPKQRHPQQQQQHQHQQQPQPQQRHPQQQQQQQPQRKPQTPTTLPPSPAHERTGPDAGHNGALPGVTKTPGLRRRYTRRIAYTPARYKNEDEYIGFATLPEQVHRKAVRKGFDFTLMVVGESGLGKSTLINSLFLSELYKDRESIGVKDLIARTVNIEKKQLEIEEKGVRLKLTIVDTPGFNDTVNASNCHEALIDYVDQQFKQFYDDESGLNRRNIVDNRVHCCLYFISPYGHGLKPIDIETMKKLHHKVNIVPLLAKSDILTKREIKRMKERIMAEIQENDIHIYEFPDCDSDEDDDFKQQDRELKACIPFAVVGCNTVVEVGGKKIRGRAYPWGIVEVDNPSHCDFVRLRQMLISTHMQDLKDVTSDIHYESYRAVHIRTQMGSTQRERNKLKRDSAPNYETIVEAEKLLEEKDAEIQRMQQMLAKMQEQLKGKEGQQQINGLGKL